MITLAQSHLIAGVEGDEFIRFAQEEAKRKHTTIRELQDQRIHLDEQIDQETAQLSALVELLRSYGVPEPNQYAIRSVVESEDQSQSEAKGFAVPGNRSEKMPDRFPKFQELSIADAVEVILENHDGPLHIRDIAARIFDIRSSEDLSRARSSMNSALAKGIKRSRWRKTEPATYVID